MALTRNFLDTIAADLKNDREFRLAYLGETIESFHNGDLSTGKGMLRKMATLRKRGAAKPRQPDRFPRPEYAFVTLPSPCPFLRATMFIATQRNCRMILWKS